MDSSHDRDLLPLFYLKRRKDVPILTLTDHTFLHEMDGEGKEKNNNPLSHTV